MKEGTQFKVLLLGLAAVIGIGLLSMHVTDKKAESAALVRGYDAGYAQGKIDAEAGFSPEDKAAMCIDWYFPGTTVAQDIKRVCNRKDWLD